MRILNTNILIRTPGLRRLKSVPTSPEDLAKHIDINNAQPLANVLSTQQAKAAVRSLIGSETRVIKPPLDSIAHDQVRGLWGSSGALRPVVRQYQPQDDEGRQSFRFALEALIIYALNLTGMRVVGGPVIRVKRESHIPTFRDLKNEATRTRIIDLLNLVPAPDRTPATGKALSLRIALLMDQMAASLVQSLSTPTDMDTLPFLAAAHHKGVTMPGHLDQRLLGEMANNVQIINELTVVHTAGLKGINSELAPQRALEHWRGLQRSRIVLETTEAYRRRYDVTNAKLLSDSTEYEGRTEPGVRIMRMRPVAATPRVIVGMGLQYDNERSKLFPDATASDHVGKTINNLMTPLDTLLLTRSRTQKLTILAEGEVVFSDYWAASMETEEIDIIMMALASSLGSMDVRVNGSAVQKSYEFPTGTRGHLLGDIQARTDNLAKRVDPVDVIRTASMESDMGTGIAYGRQMASDGEEIVEATILDINRPQYVAYYTFRFSNGDLAIVDRRTAEVRLGQSLFGAPTGSMQANVLLAAVSRDLARFATIMMKETDRTTAERIATNTAGITEATAWAGLRALLDAKETIPPSVAGLATVAMVTMGVAAHLADLLGVGDAGRLLVAEMRRRIRPEQTAILLPTSIQKVVAG